MKLLQRLACAATLSCSIGCDLSDREETLVSRSDSSGVEIVLSQGPSRSSPFPLRRVELLRDSLGETVLFSNTTTQWVRVSASGSILALDVESRRVLRWNPDGTPAGAFGGRGGGPGELRLPTTLLTSGDTVAVADAGKRAVVIWSALGDSVLDELSFDSKGRFGTSYHIRGRELMSSVDSIVQGDRIGGVRWTGQNSFLASFPVPKTTRLAMDCGPEPLERPPLLSPRLHIATSGPWFVISGTSRYEIFLGDGNRLTRLIRREHESRKPTRAEIRLAAGRGFKRTMNGVYCEVSAAELVKAFGIAEEFPAVHGLSVTNDGRVWVMRDFSRSLLGEVDEFDSDGSYRRTWLGAPTPLASLRDGRYVVALEDEESGGIVLGLVRLAPHLK